MAQIIEENIVIKVSKLVKNNEQSSETVTQDTLDALASVAEELLGAGVVVEVEKA